MGTVSPGEGDMGYITNFKDNVRIVIPELQREISPSRDLRALFKVIREIHRFKPDIIDSHTSKAGAISRIAALICSKRSQGTNYRSHRFAKNRKYL